ncbi:MAG: EVE domain-containing protein [Phycisphaerales bacterium]
MPTWLLKSEPDCYNWDQMAADKRTHWDGVHNAAAQLHMRNVQKGDEAFFYHTGNEKAIVGLCTVVKGPYPDPEQPGTTAKGDPKGVLIDIAPLRPAKTPVTLAQIKADPRFAEFLLVKISRLGVLPVPPAMDKALRKMAGF